MPPHDDEQEDRRRPHRLYGVGAEPDPRFTLANERTFLAWIRTALALMAAGVAVHALNVITTSSRTPVGTVLAVVLILGGMLVSAVAFHRWIATERALRTGRPLPPPRLAPVLGYGLAAVGVACVLLLVTWR